MNHYDARQLAGGSGWHYTCRNDGRIWAVGSCGEHDPHPTQQEAYECYTRWLLDNRLRLDGQYSNTQHRCVAPGEEKPCGEWTDRFAEVDMRMWTLCDPHRTREVVTGLLGTVGAASSSW